MLNFYRHFIRGAAHVLKPLTDVPCGTQQTKLNWTANMLTSFNTSRSSLSDITQLAHSDPTAELVLAVDALSTHVGAVFQQRDGVSGLQPLSFFSCKLDSAQLKYSAFDRELLAAYLAIRHFRWALESCHVILENDRKPLSFALHWLSDAWTPHQQRQLSFIAIGPGDVAMGSFQQRTQSCTCRNTCHATHDQKQVGVARFGFRRGRVEWQFTLGKVTRQKHTTVQAIPVPSAASVP